MIDDLDLSSSSWPEVFTSSTNDQVQKQRKALEAGGGAEQNKTPDELRGEDALILQNTLKKYMGSQSSAFV